MSESSIAVQNCVDRFRKGDVDARDDLIRSAQIRLRILTRQMFRRFPRVRPWADSSEVFQLALIRLARALDNASVRQRMSTTQDFYRLSASTIRRELIDLARKLFGPRGIATNQIAPGLLESIPDVQSRKSSDPFRLASWAELHRQIDEELNEDERIVWDLIYYQGLKLSEAAEQLKMPLRQLRGRWQQLRVRFRESLGDQWPFD